MKHKNVLLLVASMAVALTVCCATAKEAATLTRAQWLKQVGASVSDVKVLRSTIAQVQPKERVEFTQRVLKAVKALQVSPDEKAVAYVNSAMACIIGSDGDAQVIAEVFANVPVEYLPMVTNAYAEYMARRSKHLSETNYVSVVQAVTQAVVDRTAKVEDPSVRNTFAIAAMLNKAGGAALNETLVGLIPAEQTRGIVNSLLSTITTTGTYNGLLTAANVEPVTTGATPAVLQTGTPTTTTGTGGPLTTGTTTTGTGGTTTTTGTGGTTTTTGTGTGGTTTTTETGMGGTTTTTTTETGTGGGTTTTTTTEMGGGGDTGTGGAGGLGGLGDTFGGNTGPGTGPVNQGVNAIPYQDEIITITP